jgi:hypothetical protein
MFRQHLPIGFQRQLQPAPVEQGQRQVEPRSREAGAKLEGLLEGLQRPVAFGLLGAEHTEVVPGESVGRVHRHRLLIGFGRVLPAPGLVQAHAALIPELG